MRITDANLHFSGSEQKFIGSTTELSKMDLIVALNWYSSNRSANDAENYAELFFRKNLKYTNPLKNIHPTFGFICRIISNGGIIPEKTKLWFDSEVEKIKNSSKVKKTLVIEQNKPNVQDRIKEKSNSCIAELEGLFDDLVTSKFKQQVSPYAVMKSLDIKTTKDILIWAKERRQEYADISNSEVLQEGYSNFNKIQIKKLIVYFDSVILDCGRIGNEKPVIRKTRTVKAKTPEQVLAKLQYCKSCPELKLESIDPKLILGATQLYVYNTKYRKVGLYQANDASGFSVLGTTLKNFDETKSIQKIVRKPEVILPELFKAGKVALRTFMSKIMTTETALTGRLGPDTILLKVIK